MPLQRRRNIVVAAAIGGVIAGAIVAALVVLAVQTDGSTDAPAAVIPSARVTATPSVIAPPTVTAPPAMAPEVFAAYVTKNVRDINKDLNDLDAALATSKVLRIASNDEEIEYGLRQLQAAGPPADSASEWQDSVQVIGSAVRSLAKHITKKDYEAATLDVQAIRAELINTQAIAARPSSP